MKKVLLISWLLSPLLASAQYYYQDIYSTLQTNSTFALYKKNNVLKIIISSPDEDKDNNFMAEKNINSDYSQMQTITKSNATGTSTVISLFDAQGRIIQSTDSSANDVNITRYYYDENGNIIQLLLTAHSPEIVKNFSFSEVRTFYYDAHHHLVKMMRKKSDNDSSIVQFTTDENGNVTSEKENGVPAIYYKYNDRNELTDIIRYNNYSKRFLPDYMFDYKDQRQLISMTTVTSGSTNYNVWKYSYNGEGLCTQEACYQRGKNLLGTVLYKYEYAR